MCIRDFPHDINLLIRASIVFFLFVYLFVCLFVDLFVFCVCFFCFCFFVWVVVALFVCCFVLFCLGFLFCFVGLFVCFLLLFSFYLISTSKQVVIALPHPPPPLRGLYQSVDDITMLDKNLRYGLEVSIRVSRTVRVK